MFHESIAILLRNAPFFEVPLGSAVVLISPEDDAISISSRGYYMGVTLGGFYFINNKKLPSINNLSEFFDSGSPPLQGFLTLMESKSPVIGRASTTVRSRLTATESKRSYICLQSTRPL